MTVIRRLDALVLRELVVQFNRLRLDALRVRGGAIAHADLTPAITAPDANDLPSAIALANACKAAANAHERSACDPATGDGSHLVADAVNAITAPDASDAASLATLLMQLMDHVNTHMGSTVFHAAADTANTISLAGTEATTAPVSATQVKAKLNAHFANAMQSQAIHMGPV
jgi:hypothetical protein